MKAVVDINRCGVEENERIEIRTTFGVGRSITVSLTVEQFALAITGRSNNPCEVSARNIEIVPKPKVKRIAGGRP